MKVDLEKILREHGYKATKARVSILGIFSDSCNPMNTEDVYKKVKKIGVDLVTVYRTVALFEKSGILRQVSLHKDRVYYERNLDDHHHIVCTNCKRVSDFSGCEPDNFINQALRQVKDFKSVTHHSFDLFGVCNACARK